MKRKGMKIFGLGLVLLLAILAVGCGGGGLTPSTPTPTPILTPTPIPKGDAIVMEGVQFQPATLKVAVGTTVTWTNKDPFEHTVTPTDKSQWGTEGSGDDFSKWLKKGQSWSFTFTKPGLYKYYCIPHAYKDASEKYAGMIGEIIVE